MGRAQRNPSRLSQRGKMMGFATLYPSYEASLSHEVAVSQPVNPSSQKYSTLPKFGIAA
ncbi:hypothetical protein GA0061098_103315 [Bradyrhizobium shewense]|uniref:Uncharacterized protein n=1 Tax=Bradyrhizobium shewense TaxID=1761772 RepID=A0A1C3XRR7_9BRAD|nr:hypothetical protein GA0061098_103315 [Bradyrhizobium shewense]